MTPLYNVKVKLTGSDGNAFAIMGKVIREMRKAGCNPAEIKAYQDEATSGDYDHLLRATQKYVQIS